VDTKSAGVNKDVDEIVKAIAISRGTGSDELHEIITTIIATPPYYM
jgi:hypothetical protein